jgi:hypothetical protein
MAVAYLTVLTAASGLVILKFGTTLENGAATASRAAA